MKAHTVKLTQANYFGFRLAAEASPDKQGFLSAQQFGLLSLATLKLQQGEDR